MFRILTIDPEHSGTPEDGFGITDSGHFFVAICKDGFQEDKEALIFKFVEEGILVLHDKVYISGEYKLNDFNIIKDIAEGHNLEILERAFDYYVKLKSLSPRRKKIGYQSITPILGHILSKVYKAIGRYYGVNTMNLKKRKYTEFFGIACKSKLLLT